MISLTATAISICNSENGVTGSIAGFSIYAQYFGRGKKNALQTVYYHFLSWLVVEESKETDLSNSFQNEMVRHRFPSNNSNFQLFSQLRHEHHVLTSYAVT